MPEESPTSNARRNAAGPGIAVAVVVAEIDLNDATQWPGLGDFRAKIARHRPAESRGGPTPAPSEPE